MNNSFQEYTLAAYFIKCFSIRKINISYVEFIFAAMSPQYFVNADMSLLKTYDEAVTQNAFDYIAFDSGIEFNYPQGGCQQRAQMMSLILQYKFNIEHCKVWLFSPAALTPGDCRALFMQDQNNFTENNLIEWNYHVVPVMNVNVQGNLHQMVIDPSISKNGIVGLPQFFEMIGNAALSKYTFLLPDKYFFNTSVVNNEPTNLFDGSFFNFNDGIKDDLTIEKGLASNDMVMKIYHEHIQPLFAATDNKKIKRLNDFKAIFGNATAADLLFSQNISGNSENTTQRYVITNYPEVIQQARKILYERLLYWTEFSNTLMQ